MWNRLEKATKSIRGLVVLVMLAGCGTPLASTVASTSTPIPINTPVPTPAPQASPLVPAEPSIGIVALPTTRPQPGDATSQALPSAVNALSTESPLKRRDVPPEGVAAQLSYFRGGGGVCVPERRNDQPRIVMYNVQQEIATRSPICFMGLAYDQDIDARVMLPDGTMRQKRIAGELCCHSWDWESLPGDPLGEYIISARQGRIQVTGTFTIIAATAPRILVLPPYAPAGTTFRIALAGFPPQQRVPLHLYRVGGETCQEPPCWSYASALPPAQMDEHGETIYSLSTQPDDPRGGYLVDTGSAAPQMFLDSRTFSVR
jgi:hypothetical protein